MNETTVKKTVLLLAANDEYMRTLSEILQTEYLVDTATSAAAALRQIADHTPTLIFAGLRLPDMDGYAFSFCRQLQENAATRDIPLIFIRTQAEDAALGLAAGAVDYLDVPFDPALTRARARNHLSLCAYRQELERISTVDALTGVANRRHFDAVVEREWHRALRLGSSISMMTADVDRLQAFNDAHGHATGDQCLQRIAQTLAGELKRSSDLAARLEGGTFACVLPDTSTENAGNLAANTLNAIRALAIPHADSPIAPHVTISIGVVSLTPFSSPTPAPMMELAAQRLRRAKKAGGNRWVGNE